jgi:hypothetical protein
MSLLLSLSLTLSLTLSPLSYRFCYQAATCNAGNRLSVEVTSHMFHDTYNPFESHLEHKTHATSIPSPSAPPRSPSPITEQILRSSHSKAQPSSQLDEGAIAPLVSKQQLLASQRQWKDFEDNIRSTLHWRSTAKHPTGPSTKNLTRQVAKLMVPVERRLNNTTLFLDTFSSSPELLQTIIAQPSSPAQLHSSSLLSAGSTAPVLKPIPVGRGSCQSR